MIRFYLFLLIFLMGFSYVQYSQWLGLGPFGSNNQLLAMWLLGLFLLLPWHIHRKTKEGIEKRHNRKRP